jgi:hypothetical protein
MDSCRLKIYILFRSVFTQVPSSAVSFLSFWWFSWFGTAGQRTHRKNVKIWWKIWWWCVWWKTNVPLKTKKIYFFKLGGIRERGEKNGKRDHSTERFLFVLNFWVKGYRRLRDEKFKFSNSDLFFKFFNFQVKPSLLNNADILLLCLDHPLRILNVRKNISWKS